MIFRTSGRRVEVERTAGYVFVRLPIPGEVLWSRMEGFQRWPWSDVRAQLEREQQEQREAHAALTT